VLLFFLDWLVHSLILVDTNAADTFSVAGLTTCNGPACGAVQVLMGRRDMARVEWSQQDFVFSIVLGGTFLGTLKLDHISPHAQLLIKC